MVFNGQRLIKLHYSMTSLYVCTIEVLSICRGVVAESDDIIKASVISLGKNGFINYFGLQVLCFLFLSLVNQYVLALLYFKCGSTVPTAC